VQETSAQSRSARVQGDPTIIECVVVCFSAAADGRAFTIPGDGYFIGGYGTSTANVILSKDPTLTIANTITAPGDSVRLGVYLLGGINRGQNPTQFRVPVFLGETWYACSNSTTLFSFLLERL